MKFCATSGPYRPSHLCAAPRIALSVPAGAIITIVATMGLVIGLGGCEDAARHVAVSHPVQSPAPAKAPARPPARVVSVVGPLPLDPAGRGRVLALGLTAPDGAGRLAQLVQARLAAGQQAYKDGRLEIARQEFDRALGLLRESGFDLAVNPALEALRRQIVEAARSAETVATNSDAFTEPKTETAPMDEIAASASPTGEPPEAPVDPLLRTRAEGEIVAVPHDLPLTVNDVVLSYLNFFQTSRGRAIVETGLTRAGRYRPMIERVLREEGLPNDLMYMAQAESAFQPQALSKAGARGLWQFMSFRGKEYGLEHSWWVDDRQDPEKATRAAAHHLRDLYNMFGDWYLAMAAYDSGPGTVQHAVEHTGYADFWQLYRMNALPKETRDYVPIILALTLIAKDPARYGIEVDPQEPLRTDEVQPGHPVDLRLVAETVDVDLNTLRMLNPQLLRLVTPADASFVLHLPEGTADRFTAEMSEIPPEKWASWRRHRITEGETLSGIAQQYRVSVAAIVAANSLEPRAPLDAGTKLIIPVSPQPQGSPGKLLRYRGRTNDTVESVADEFDVNAADLRKWNRLRGNQSVHNLRLKIYLGGSDAPPATEKAGAGSAGASATASRANPASNATTNATPNATTKATLNSATAAKASKNGVPAAANLAEAKALTTPAPKAAAQSKSTEQARVARATPVSGAAPAEARPLVHRVKPGETLYSIARTYQTTVEALRSGNRFLLSRSLEAGDTLRIPPAP